MGKSREERNEEAATLVMAYADNVVKRYEDVAKEAVRVAHEALAKADNWKARALKAERYDPDKLATFLDAFAAWKEVRMYDTLEEWVASDGMCAAYDALTGEGEDIDG